MTVQELCMENVEKVYTSRKGKQNACCCGCSGKYYYTEAHSKEAAERSGEVNERQVARVLNKIEKNMELISLEKIVPRRK